MKRAGSSNRFRSLFGDGASTQDDISMGGTAVRYEEVDIFSPGEYPPTPTADSEIGTNGTPSSVIAPQPTPPYSTPADMEQDTDTFMTGVRPDVDGGSKLRHRCLQYHRGWSGPTVPLSQHLDRAKELAKALLSYYFPESQGFSVREEHFNVMAKYGFPIPLEIPSGHEKEEPPQHVIPPELIAGFVVEKVYDPIVLGEIREQRRMHTVFAILIDDLSTFPQWQRKPRVSRGALLEFTLGVNGKMSRGAGIVIMGPRIEFYEYDINAKRDTVTGFTDKDFPHRDWVFGMGLEDLDQVDQVLQAMAKREVKYQDGFVADGAQ